MSVFYPTNWIKDLFYYVSSLQPTDKSTIGLGGVRDLGKTTAIIQLWEHLASLQPANSEGIRHLKVALLRGTFEDINRTVLDSMSEWYEWHVTGNSYEQVYFGSKQGMAARSLRQAPEIVTFNKTKNWLDILNGREPREDGTYTRIHYVGISTNKPDFASKFRGLQVHSGWLNEAPTQQYEALNQLTSVIGRPESIANRSIILCDYNFPNPMSDSARESKENIGYEWVKTEFGQKGITPLGRDAEKYSIHLEPPYHWIEDSDAKQEDEDPRIGVYFREYRGKNGFLVENDNFPAQVPYKKKPFSRYEQKLSAPDNIVQTDLLGEFGDDGAGEAVYYMFSKHKHVVEEIDPIPSESIYHDKKLIVSIDFGLSQPAALVSFIDDMNRVVILKEFVKKDTPLRDMLRWDIIPYLEETFPWHYKRNQIIFVGDPTSGNTRNYINSATPLNVLTGLTDEDGKEDGEGLRYSFNAVSSPCHNQIKFRIDSSFTYLNREGGVFIHEDCETLIKALEREYVWGTNGKPKKVQNDIYTGVVDSMQYLFSFLYAGGDYKVEAKQVYLTKHIRKIQEKKRRAQGRFR